VRLLLRTLLWRPLRRRPLRFLVTVAGVAIGVAAVVATVSASRAAVASLREGVEAITPPAALEVTRPGGVDEAWLERLRPLAGEAVIAPVIEEIALLPELGDAVRVLGLDPLLGGALVGGAGGLPAQAALERVLRGEAVLLPEALARRLGGPREVTLAVRARRVTLPVAASFRPRRLAGAWESVVVVDVALAQELFGRVGRLDRIELQPRAGTTAGPLVARARALLPADARVDEPAARGARTGRMVRALEFNLTALSGISLVVGGVLVATTLATSVVQRRSVIALLRSLGAAPRQLAAALLVEAAAIGVLGGTAGVAGGLFGGRAALASVRATVAAVVQGVPPAGIALDADVALLGVGLALAVSLAAAVLPLAEALRTPPIQNLRQERPTALHGHHHRGALAAALGLGLAAAALAHAPPVDELPVAALLGSLALLGAALALAAPLVDALARLGGGALTRRLGMPVRLAAAALAAGRQRSAWAAGAVGVTVALAVAVAIMVHSFRTTVVDWSEQALRSDLWLRPLAADTGFGVGRLDPEIVDIARRLFGADAVDPFHTREAWVGGTPVTLGAGAMTVVARRAGLPFRGERDGGAVFLRTVREHGAVVNEPFANRFGVGLGDEVRLEAGGREIVRRVTGVFYDYSRQHGMVVIDLDDYLSQFPDDGPQEIGLFLPAGSDPAVARDRLLAALGGRFLVEAFLNRELRREVVALFDRTFAITVALQAVAAVVAVIAVLTVLFALVDERRRDLAVLRAVGASRGQVTALVVTEAGLLGLAGVVLGLVAGALVGVVLVRVVNLQSFGWTLRFLVPTATLGATAVALVLACLAAGLAPAALAARLMPQEELREEG
jgi:putative ABC transport system permease protein